jgi:hypothetical protein
MAVFILSKYADKEFTDLFCEKNNIIYISENKYLNIQESCHADMQIFKTGNNSCILAPGFDENAKNAMINHGISVFSSNEELSFIYPENIKFNVLRADTHCFHNTKYTSRYIKDFANNNKIDFVNVKQGYCACSSLYVPFCNLIITGDNGIISAAKGKNYNVCIFEHTEEIVLEGYDHGFIGGCAACVDNGKRIYFTGDILNRYPVFANELMNYGIEIICVKDSPLKDIGGVIHF